MSSPAAQNPEGVEYLVLSGHPSQELTTPAPEADLTPPDQPAPVVGLEATLSRPKTNSELADLPTLQARAPIVPLPVIPGYKVVRRLGQGGMGEVYEVVNRLGRHFALKMIRPDLADFELLARFRREAGTLLDVDHPHIARIFTYDEIDGVPHFTMRLLTGGTLQTRMKEFRSDHRRAAELMAAVADAVGYLHQRGLLHRDLKPGNVLFDDDGRPFVTDFGLVRVDARDEPISEGPPPSPEDSDLTERGRVLGTLPYMAPEQLRGDLSQIGPASDVWSLGVMFYELLLGQRPFPGPGRELYLAQIALGRPIEMGPEVPAELQRIVQRCLRRAPGERYADGTALAEDLRRFLKPAPTVAEPTLPAQSRHASSRWHLPAVALACFVLAILFAVSRSHTTTENQAASQPDREPAMRHLRRELQAGRAVRLIDHQPLIPPVIRFGETHLYQEPDDGAWSVQAVRVGLVELVDDPGIDSYRFRVEVRQNTRNEMDHAGLYYAHHVFPFPEGTAHVFGSFSFRDTFNQSPIERETALRTDYLPHGQFLRRSVFIIRPGSTSLKAAGPGIAWRPLELEVNPKTFILRWPGTPEVVINRPITGDRLKVLQSILPKDVTRQIDFSPRRGLGLYVVGGSASFRNAVIEPVRKP